MQPTRNQLFCSQLAVRRAEICFSHSCRLLPRTSFSSLPMPRFYAALQAFIPLLVLLRCAPLVPNLLLADPLSRISASLRADFLLLVRCTTLTPIGCCFRVTSARRCRAESKLAAENARRAAFSGRKAALMRLSKLRLTFRTTLGVLALAIASSSRLQAAMTPYPL